MRSIFILLPAIFLMYSAHAQEIGIKAGANIANLRAAVDGDAESGDAAFDFHFGGYAEFELTDFVSFQPEILFSREGSKESEDGITLRILLNTIQVPLLFKFQVNELLNIHLGPQVGFILSSKLRLDGNSFAVDEAFNTVTFGAVGGLGFDVGEKFEVGGRYNLGLTDILKDDNSDLKTTSNVIQVFVAYRLR